MIESTEIMQPTDPATNQNPAQNSTTPKVEIGVLKFPYKEDIQRLQDYDYNEKLFLGKHFEAFRVRINSEIWTREYGKMRYIVANFAGLVSKIVADLLFIEPPKLVAMDGDQDFIDALQSENQMRVQNYESGIQNSYLGDQLYKLRVGKRHENDEDSTVIIEQVTPRIYFPRIDPNNVKGTPLSQELAWVVTIGTLQYLRKEIHTPGKIRNELWLVEGNMNTGFEIKGAASIDLLGIPGLQEEEDTGIKRSLLIHIPNWRPGNRHFGLSDYQDLESIFFAINNRITKVDNILDKHSDPILALPEGILDENGKIKRSKLGLIERPEGADKNTDPQYITWDANLDAAFKQIDKLVEFLYMMSETSPDVLGMGQGQEQSGRALKLKLLRTLAKTQRKQLYYHEGLQEVMYVAQLLAKEHSLTVGDKKLEKDPVRPEIVWADGLPKDMTEAVANEVAAVDAGLTSKSDAIQRLYDVEEATAEEILKEIKDESKLDIPITAITANVDKFGKPIPPKPGTNPVDTVAQTKDTAPADTVAK